MRTFGKDCPDLSEYADDERALLFMAGTTQFWGESADHDSDDYSHGNLCPLCLDDGIENRVTNRATLCIPHRNAIRAKSKQQTAALCRLARRKRHEKAHAMITAWWTGEEGLK